MAHHGSIANPAHDRLIAGAYASGAYAAAYEPHEYGIAAAGLTPDAFSTAYVAAFTLGFFAVRETVPEYAKAAYDAARAHPTHARLSDLGVIGRCAVDRA